MSEPINKKQEKSCVDCVFYPQVSNTRCHCGRYVISGRELYDIREHCPDFIDEEEQDVEENV